MSAVVMFVLVGVISVCFHRITERIWHGVCISLSCFRILQSHTASFYILWVEVLDICCTSSITQAQEKNRKICLSGKFSNYMLVL